MSTAPQKAHAVERVLQQLRAKVVSGALMPGEQIRQQEMAEELGVSRVPLREALNLLADQGVLLHRPNSGYFVAKRAPNELLQISRIIQLLENELMESIEWPDDAVIEQLKDLNAQMRACATAKDWTPLVHLNSEFHLRIFSLSPHRVILEEVKRLWWLVDMFIATKMSEVEARLKTVDEHDRLIDSLVRRDRELCLRVQTEHRSSTTGGMKPRMQAWPEQAPASTAEAGS
ncbi:MAG: GntR family transcriptional regulator [Ramlibacter sp.]|nr:GntR family transcriptional regulator [Ramlibacter sp.]